jgi:hypothetical protein
MSTKLKNRPLFLFGVVCAALFGIASSNALALTVANGNFSDTNGLTAMTDGWYSGVPTGWTTTAPSTTSHGYSVRQIDDVSYANLDVLGNVKGGWYPLRQTIGILNTDTNLTVSFKATSLNGNPYKLTSAIYNASNDTPLAVFSMPAPVNGVTRVTYSAQGIPAGTEIYVAFWSDGVMYSPGITDVEVSLASSTNSLTLEPGATLLFDAAAPVTTPMAGNLIFENGAKVRVAGSPAYPSTVLLTSSGAISGSPSLDPAVEGYTLTNSGKVLWFRGPLALLNANFQDLGGLTDNGGGWYNGVPFGWSSSTGSLNFNVINYSSGNLGANLQTLGPSSPTFTPLYQSAGLLDSTGNVTLRFNILGISTTYGMGAAIYNASSGTGPGSGWTILTQGSYDQTVSTTQTLIAANVAAGTTIGVGFWRWAGSPGIDNVNLSITYANRAPTDVSLSGASISENNLVGDVVGTLSTTDLDSGDTHTYSLVSGDGDTDNASFEIDGSTLKANVVFDYETQASYSIRVRSTDAGSLFTEKTFTITVTDVAEQTPQQAYLASFGLSEDDLLGTADPDGDGMDNDAEFAFGTNPVSGASRAVTLTSGTGEIILTYLQRKTGVTYTVKSLSDLTTPFDSGTPVTPYLSGNQESLPSDDYERYEAKLTTNSSRGFLQVKAVAP